VDAGDHFGPAADHRGGDGDHRRVVARGRGQSRGRAAGTQTVGLAAGTQTVGLAAGTQTVGLAAGTQTVGLAAGAQNSRRATGTQTVDLPLVLPLARKQFCRYANNSFAAGPAFVIAARTQVSAARRS